MKNLNLYVKDHLSWNSYIKKENVNRKSEKNKWEVCENRKIEILEETMIFADFHFKKVTNSVIFSFLEISKQSNLNRSLTKYLIYFQKFFRFLFFFKYIFRGNIGYLQYSRIYRFYHFNFQKLCK